MQWLSHLWFDEFKAMGNLLSTSRAQSKSSAIIKANVFWILELHAINLSFHFPLLLFPFSLFCTLLTAWIESQSSVFTRKGFDWRSDGSAFAHLQTKLDWSRWVKFPLLFYLFIFLIYLLDLSFLFLRCRKSALLRRWLVASRQSWDVDWFVRAVFRSRA